jgi:hypothetical protein
MPQTRSTKRRSARGRLFSTDKLSYKESDQGEPWDTAAGCPSYRRYCHSNCHLLPPSKAKGKQTRPDGEGSGGEAGWLGLPGKTRGLCRKCRQTRDR